MANVLLYFVLRVLIAFRLGVLAVKSAGSGSSLAGLGGRGTVRDLPGTHLVAADWVNSSRCSRLHGRSSSVGCRGRHLLASAPHPRNLCAIQGWIHRIKHLLRDRNLCFEYFSVFNHWAWLCSCWRRRRASDLRFGVGQRWNSCHPRYPRNTKPYPW